LKAKTRGIPSTKPELVFDIGLNNGDDAAYYLHLGYRVLGVEANPVLAAQCSRRFAHEIRAGRITVVNAGVLRQPGEFTFYRSLQEDGWSTFAPDVHHKSSEWEELTVRCTTARELIAEHGQPVFIKVDIEGADFQVLETLTPSIAPAYISLELNSIDPFVERLITLGYTAFKFVDGLNFHPTPPIFNHQIGWRLLRRAGRAVPVFHGVMRRLPHPLRPKREWNAPGRYSPDGYAFAKQSSGPFGERAGGSWLAPDAAREWLARLKSDYEKAGKLNELWWDVHARHSSAPKRRS
jgi:FkbM family methyltransferase